MSNAIDELKLELGQKLKRPDQIKAPMGVSSGLRELDEYLIWKGFPKGEISLLTSQPGLGSTTLLFKSISLLTSKGLWASWMEHKNSQVCPWSLKTMQADLSKLLIISAPESEKKLIWAVSELCSLSLFELIICDITHLNLKRHHLIKMRQLAKRYQVSVVFKDEKPQYFLQSFYALAIQFQPRFLEIQRAQHRPTPIRMERRAIYENFMPQLTEARKAFSRRELSGF